MSGRQYLGRLVGLLKAVRTAGLANLGGDGLLIEVQIGKVDLHTVCLNHRFIIITKNKEQISINRFIKINPQTNRAPIAVQRTQLCRFLAVNNCIRNQNYSPIQFTLWLHFIYLCFVSVNVWGKACPCHGALV